MYAEQLEAEFLKKHYAEYYSKNYISSITSVEKREFGYGVFGRKILDRNLAFSSLDEMNAFLREKKPLFFSYSNACYKYPERKPMINKELISADIVYEFDADDFVENVVEVDGKQWFFEEDIELAKKQVFRLLDFLENDFGFNNGIRINFSGKAGFHIHLESQEVQQLSKQARIQLVDYLTGYGLVFEKHGFDFEAMICNKPKSKWAERLLSCVKNFLELDAKTLSKITGIQQKKIKNLLSSKEEVIKGMNNCVFYGLDSKKDSVFWKTLFEKAVEKERIPIDRQTSVDLHKIIRVPETLHGETSLCAKLIPIDDLKKFDAFSDAVVFSDEPIKIFIKKAPRFKLGKESFGPFNECEEELPLYCAAYLIGKGARLVKS